jgi:hypothetical protein
MEARRSELSRGWIPANDRESTCVLPSIALGLNDARGRVGVEGGRTMRSTWCQSDRGSSCEASYYAFYDSSLPNVMRTASQRCSE